MDGARSVRCFGAAMHGPGADFFWALGEERDQLQQFIAGTNDPGEAGFFEAQSLQELGFFLGRA